MEINLNTAETSEYKEWLALMKELRLIHDVLKKAPNAEGLKLARSHAYNILADIHDLLEIAEGKKPTSNKEIADPLDDISNTLKSLN